MAFKLATKAAATSPAAAHRGGLARGPEGTSRVAFGPAPRNKGLRAANNSATPVAKYERSSWLEIV
jgi:chorismate mutase